jgi:translation initiation factor IF-2
MGKTRVYELAKRLHMGNKELVDRLTALGYAVKSHSSTVDDSEIDSILKRLQGPQPAPAPAGGRSVIRRRRKIVEVPQEEPAAAEAPALVQVRLEEVAAKTEAVPTAALEPQEPPPPEVSLEAGQEATAPPPEPPTEPVSLQAPAAAAGEAAAEVVPPKVTILPEKEARPRPRPSPTVTAKKIGSAAGEPARIISRPRIVPPRQPEAARPQEPTLVEVEIPPFTGVPLETPAEEWREGAKKKRRKKARGQAEAGPDEGLDFKKGLRRREIIEQTDLYDEDQMPRAGGRFRRGVRVVKAPQKTTITTPKAIKRRIKITEAIVVADLAKKMGIKAQEVLRKLIGLGVMGSINQAIDYDTANLIGSEFGYEITKGTFDEGEILHSLESEERGVQAATRPPVVTVMGHVDHGKTSLLDAIRQTNVISGEVGGITQHIGAYHVVIPKGEITFLDTPGHEAFTAMRARGARVTDIVVLIVAADDGVMAQTREAIDHARAAAVPILVAINKIDKPEANPERIKRELAEIGLTPEEWGGETIFVNVSARTKEGIPELLDMILLQAEMSELKAMPEGKAQGRVIEAHLDRGRGPVATILIQSGKLRTGDPFVCGNFHGKTRAMFDDSGDKLDEAGPSVPVEVQGLTGVPAAGDEFIVVEDDRQAKQISQHRQFRQREAELIKTSKVTLENLYERIRQGEGKELILVLKADVQGSLEAITDALSKLSTDEIVVNIIHSSTGAINETDVILAAASKASIIGFNVRPNTKVQEMADQENVEIRYYDVIYKLTEEVKEAMTGMLEPTYVEQTIGQAEVKEAFHVSKVGTVAGSSVTSGRIVRGAKVRLLRDGVVLYDGVLSSLKRFKEDAKEVTSGYECGIGLENFNDIKAGDLIEAYVIEEKAATL